LPLAALGCYTLHQADGQLLDSTYYNSAPRVRLDTMTIARRSDQRQHLLGLMEPQDALGRSLDDPERRQRAPTDDSPAVGAIWSGDSLSDSVWMDFGGLSFTFLVVAPVGGHWDTLRGRVGEAWDVGPRFTARGQAIAVRVPCNGTSP
jgi:hypothetical protein